VRAARPIRVWLAVLGGAAALALAALAVSAVLRADVGGGIIWTALFAAVGLGVGVGFERTGGETGLPHLLNAVVLSTAEVRPPDSWIHFFRERGPGRWMTAFFAATGWLSSVLLVWLSLIVIGRGGSELIVLIVLVPILLAAFGRRPIGISLGRHGVIRYYLDGVDVWPWESIARVRAEVQAVDQNTGDFDPLLVLVPTPDAADLTESSFSLGSHQAHPWLIYSAVRFWAEHPEHRDELSTTFAHQRIRSWRDAIAPPAGGGRGP
jgi:hypothetical protein